MGASGEMKAKFVRWQQMKHTRAFCANGQWRKIEKRILRGYLSGAQSLDRATNFRLGTYQVD